MIVECEIALEAIREDRSSGASELAHRAVRCLILFSETSKNSSPLSFKRDILNFMHGLISCQPAMAALLNLANAVLMRTEGEKDVDGIKEATGEVAHDKILTEGLTQRLRI